MPQHRIDLTLIVDGEDAQRAMSVLKQVENYAESLPRVHVAREEQRASRRA